MEVWAQQNRDGPSTRVKLEHWTTRLLKTTVIHMAKNLEEMEAEVETFRKCRYKYVLNQSIPDARIIWEYQPDSTTDFEGRWQRVKQVIVEEIAVFLIKWEDLVGLFTRRDGLPQTPDAPLPEFLPHATELHADALTDSRTTMIVSCGEHGYLYYGGDHSLRWYPAHHH